MKLWDEQNIRNKNITNLKTSMSTKQSQETSLYCALPSFPYQFISFSYFFNTYFSLLELSNL